MEQIETSGMKIYTTLDSIIRICRGGSQGWGCGWSKIWAENAALIAMIREMAKYWPWWLKDYYGANIPAGCSVAIVNSPER